jgi:hypothetical protein
MILWINYHTHIYRSFLASTHCNLHCINNNILTCKNILYIYIYFSLIFYHLCTSCVERWRTYFILLLSVSHIIIIVLRSNWSQMTISTLIYVSYENGEMELYVEHTNIYISAIVVKEAWIGRLRDRIKQWNISVEKRLQMYVHV